MIVQLERSDASVQTRTALKNVWDRAEAAIIEGIDERFLPETTEGREPYLHPYIASGDVTKVELKVLVRAFSVRRCPSSPAFRRPRP